MKIRTGHLMIFYLFIICTGCNNIRESQYYKSFMTEFSISGKLLNTDSVSLRYPFRIKYQNNLAIVMDLHHPDHFYHAFTYPQFEYISSFGKRGQAPEEMLSAENFRLVGDYLWGLDANKQQITTITTRGVHQLEQIKEISLDKEIIRALDFALYDDSCFIIPDYSGTNRFHIVNKSGKIVSSHGKIPSKKHKVGDMPLAQAWRSFIDYNPRNHTLAMVTQLGEVLEIYNLKDSTMVLKIGPHGEPKYRESGGVAIPSGIMGFSDVQVTDKYIYAAFQGRSFKDIAQQQQPAIDGGQFIYVFSLKGLPLYKYTLNHFIYGITVNEETKELYTLDVNSNQPIIKYELKHL